MLLENVIWRSLSSQNLCIFWDSNDKGLENP